MTGGDRSARERGWRQEAGVPAIPVFMSGENHSHDRPERHEGANRDMKSW
jgi:hypothetical protein